MDGRMDKADLLDVGIQHTTSKLSWKNYLDHWIARWGIRRMMHRVEPGLYELGHPGPGSPVFVTANYTLSFDALRTSLNGVDAYILVLDTQAINVWCAANKGTFGTEELVHRLEVTRLSEVVVHRKLILPQLGAPGIAGFQVTKRTGFHVEYGPVRAKDLREYLHLGHATPEMRQVRFTLKDRVTLIPVELVYVLPWLFLTVVIMRSLPATAAVLAGVVLVPILLPWLPTHNFSVKGWFLGLLAVLPFALRPLFSNGFGWLEAGWGLGLLLMLPPVTAFIALNFTGSTTFTSRTGVRREIFRYIPPMAWSFGIGSLLTLLLSIIKARG